MQRHGRNPRLRVITLAAALMVGLWQGVAFAQVSGPEAPSVDGPQAPDTGDAPSAPAPEDDAPPAPSAPSGSTNTQQAPAAPQVAQPEPQDDGDTPPHETENPEATPHASGSVADVVLLDGELPVLVGATYAEVDPNDGDSSASDVTVLAIAGQEIVGAHADSEGDTQDSEGGARIACEESEGQLCLGLLYARAIATEDADSSQASGDTALAFACLGGANPDATNSEECTGAPVAIGVSESHSEIHKDKNTGEMTADQETRLANVCLGGEDPLTGACAALGAEAVESESHSEIRDNNNNYTTEDDTGTSSRRSCVLVVQAGGEDAIPICAGDGEEGQNLSIPQECTDPSLICLFLNQGEAAEYVGGAWSRQEAIHIAFPGPAGEILFGHLGTAETLVAGQVGICPPGTTGTPPNCIPIEPPPPCPEGFVLVNGECRFPCPPDGQPLVENRDDCPGGGGGDGDIVPRGGLAVTGAGLLPLVAVSLILGAGGLGAIATERRRRMP